MLPLLLVVDDFVLRLRLDVERAVAFLAALRPAIFFAPPVAFFAAVFFFAELFTVLVLLIPI